jgi:hypothetical protein
LVLGASLTTKTSMRGRVVPLKGIPIFILFIKAEGAPVHGIATFIFLRRGTWYG